MKAIETADPTDRMAQAYPPQQVRLQMLGVLGRHDEAIAAYQQMQAGDPQNPYIRQQIEDLRVQKYMDRNDTAGAARELEAIIAGYAGQSDPGLLANVQTLRRRLAELRGEPEPSTTSTAGTDSGNASGANVGGTTR
jgi:hypothetical protein